MSRKIIVAFSVIALFVSVAAAPAEGRADADGNVVNQNVVDYLKGRTDSTAGFEGSPKRYVNDHEQREKISFLDSQKKETRVINRARTKNMLTCGMVINATLVSSVNSDLPGTAIAVVNQNVFDSFSMENILIPKGSRIVGQYDSVVSFGQTRVLFAWNQIIRPDGTIIQLGGYESMDGNGAGLGGRTNNHVGEIIGGAILSTLLNVSSGLVLDLTLSDALRALTTGSNINVSTPSSQVMGKVMNRQPTITIGKGTTFSILVNDNVEIPVYKGVTRGDF